jgi:hypothetical protein
MDIQTAAKYMKHGYRVRRSSWRSDEWISERFLIIDSSDLSDLLADDWEIVTEGIIMDFPLTYSNSDFD